MEQKIKPVKKIGMTLLAIGKRLFLRRNGNQEAAAAIEKKPVLTESIATQEKRGAALFFAPPNGVDARDFYLLDPTNPNNKRGGC